MSHSDKTAAERQARYQHRKAQEGYVRKQYFIPAELVAEVDTFVLNRIASFERKVKVYRVPRRIVDD